MLVIREMVMGPVSVAVVADKSCTVMTLGVSNAVNSATGLD